MRLSRAAAPALAAALLAACRGAVDDVDHLQADPLYQRAEKVALSASCAWELGRMRALP